MPKMTKEEAIQQQIDEIMDTFDFGKVHNMMEAVDWRWARCESAPEEYEIRLEARRLLKCAARSGYGSCGGLTATMTSGEDDDGPWVKLDLSFGVSAHNDGVNYEREGK